MPLPSRKKGEDKDAFISRCVSKLKEKGEGESQEQRVAICMSRAAKQLTDAEMELLGRILKDG